MESTIKAPVAILGYGVEGQASYKYLQGLGISEITICDQNEKTKIPKDAKSILGSKAFDELKAFKTIFRSPGVHYDLPGIVEAREAGSNVTSLTELTLEVARDRMTAITGSSGKTSVVGMLEAVLKAHYKDALIVGGNDREPVLQKAIDNPNQPILMEVSSFQFADIKKSPNIAAVLNISPNHLDWHENMQDYVHAKTNLIAHQKEDDWCVLNSDDENSEKLARSAPSRQFWVGMQEGQNWAIWADDYLVAQLDGKRMTILNKQDLQIKTHPDNILFAVAVSLLHKVDPEIIEDELIKFEGIENRLEFVREIDSIKFYNDSACTTPESAWVAIQQFPEGKAILILGGSSKGADFSFLAHHIKETSTRVYLYGEEADRIRDALKEERCENLILNSEAPESFIEIVNAAYKKAGPRDYIVLSPACASFDMFKNSKDRGKQFKDIVKSL